MVTGMKKPSRATEVVSIAALAYCSVGLATGADTYRFNIPEEDAPAAIRDFSSQAHVQIVVAGESVSGKRLHAVVGELSADEALRLLLAGSGLTPRHVGDRSIALVADTNTLPAAGTPAATPQAAESDRPPPVQSDPPVGEKTGKSVPEVMIQAKRERERIEHEANQFVAATIVHEWGHPMLRWKSKICPLVAGLPHEQGEFILARLSRDVRNADAPLASEKCGEPNLLILVTPEPEKLLDQLHHKLPRMFSSFFNGYGAMRVFIKTARPVRVWYNWQYAEGDVSPYGILALAGLPGGTGSFNVVPSTGSRITYGALRGLQSVIVAVDLTRMQGVNIGQLADYIAMVSLAEIDLDKPATNVPTVLQLFDGPGGAPTEGMTQWDRALLRALYHSPETDVMWFSQVKWRTADFIVQSR